MKRKIGVTTWVFGNIDLVEAANITAEIGFDGVELFVDIESIPAQETKKVFADKGLEIYSLTPGNVDLASSDFNIRKHALNYYKNLINYEYELGQPIITCHEYIQPQMGTYSGSIELLVESCQELAVYAQQFNINLGFEPLNRYLCRFILKSTDALALLNQINTSNMTVILDAFHMNLEEDNPAEAIIQCGTRLSVYQISDSNRKGIGFGHIDFTKQFAALDAIKYTNPIVVECAHPRQTPGSAVPGSLDEIKLYIATSKDWLTKNAIADNYVVV